LTRLICWSITSVIQTNLIIQLISWYLF